MGARGVGHLAELCAIAPPDISLVLNVGRAHIGEFGSREQIAVAKGELVEALAPDGAAVLNLDDPLVATMATARRPASGPSVRARLPRCASATYRSTTWAGRPSTSTTGGRPSTSPSACSASTRRSTPPPPRRPHWRPVSSSTRRREPARDRPALSDADGAARARRRPRGHQRRLQRQPGLDAVRAGDPRPHGPLRQADGRRAGGDARARRHRRGGAPAGRAAPRAARHRRGRGRRARRPRGVRRPSADDGQATTRYVETATEAGEWLRENVAGPDVVLVKASRSGRLETVADMLVGDPTG